MNSKPLEVIRYYMDLHEKRISSLSTALLWTHRLSFYPEVVEQHHVLRHLESPWILIAGRAKCPSGRYLLTKGVSASLPGLALRLVLCIAVLVQM
jgi:hypothetical protein